MITTRFATSSCPPFEDYSEPRRRRASCPLTNWRLSNSFPSTLWELTAIGHPISSRFTTLDSIRGVAAVVVVLYHLKVSFPLGIWAPHEAYLAVDLFFGLSGFVLARSYDRHFAAGMTAGQFMLKRAIRLMPLYWLGLVAGLAVAALTDFTIQGGPPEHPAASTLLNVALLPGASLWLFPFDTPSWSLFFELWIANLIFACLWRFLHGRTLGVVIVVSALTLVARRMGHTDLNQGYMWGNFLGGCARVMFSFFAGIALSRLHAVRPPQLRVPSILVVAFVPILLSAPLQGKVAGVWELGCVFLAFPAMIYWGAEAVEKRPWLGSQLGNASYALYATHWPLLIVISALVGRLGLAPSLALEAIALILATSLASVIQTPDQMVRKWLGRQLQLGGA
jgi:peptidoglycan/LPS O-acetylase OafA/YrhL